MRCLHGRRSLDLQVLAGSDSRPRQPTPHQKGGSGWIGSARSPVAEAQCVSSSSWSFARSSVGDVLRQHLLRRKDGYVILLSTLVRCGRPWRLARPGSATSFATVSGIDRRRARESPIHARPNFLVTNQTEGRSTS